MKVPLVVLVNRATAGAAEIVAAAILENSRGDVVGERTYGVGSVQKVIPLDDGSALILSVAKYYSPGGKSIQDHGVTPNVLVADSEVEDAGIPDDDNPVEPRPERPSTPREDTIDRKSVV